jgi:hypothetical protein
MCYYSGVLRPAGQDMIAFEEIACYYSSQELGGRSLE